MNFIKSSEFNSLEEYLNCYVWLTTTRGCDTNIPNNFSNILCSFEFYIPNTISIVIEELYWQNYTWICKTYITIDSKNNIYMSSGIEYHHFKMVNKTDERYPPIPKFLVDLWKINLK